MRSNLGPGTLGEKRVVQFPQRSGGGGMDGFEPRIAALEATTSAMRDDVSDLKTEMRDVRDRLSRLEVKVDHLPTKEYIGRFVVAAMSAGILWTTFQEEIRQFLGLSG